MPTALTLLLSMPKVEGEEQETWIIMTISLIHTNVIFTMKEANCKQIIDVQMEMWCSLEKSSIFLPVSAVLHLREEVSCAVQFEE